jgi:hypothetical protein
MYRICAWSIVAVAVCAPTEAAAAKYSIKTAMTPLPTELGQPITKLLGEQSIQLIDDKGGLLAELWLRKDVPSKATAAQVKNGLTYRELDETTLLGAVRVIQLMTDYRKHKVKPGVYTLRLGFQPMDGDHMGTAPYTEFGLLTPAAIDTKPDPMEPKALHELSSKAASGSHPAVFLLLPNSKPKDEPLLVGKPNNNWVLNWKEEVMADGQKAALGFALTLIGHAE